MRVSRLNKSGQISKPTSTRSALAIIGSFDHCALAKLMRSAISLVTLPRSTFRSPSMRSCRPVLACTAISRGRLNQFQSNNTINNTSAASSAPSTICARRDGLRLKNGRLKNEVRSRTALSMLSI
jgi:hypothetical protein